MRARSTPILIDLAYLSSEEILIQFNKTSSDFPLVKMSGHLLCMSRTKSGFGCSLQRKHTGLHIALKGHGGDMGKLIVLQAWDTNGIIYHNIESCRA